MVRVSHLFYVVLMGFVLSLFQSSCTNLSEWIDESSHDERVFRFNPSSEYDSLMVALKPADNPNVVSFLWFTDVHGDSKSLRRVLLWHDRYRDYFDDIISTGDQQDTYFTDQFDWWHDNGADQVLQVIGNHDAWISTDMFEAGKYEGEIVRKYGKESQFCIMSQKDTYNKFFSPVIGSWKVVSPESASQLGQCYYYKDYGNLRLIVLDCKHYGTEDDLDENKNSRQDKWFKLLLDDACRNQISVVAVSHYPPAYVTPIPCSFTLKSTTGEYADRLNSAAYKRIKSFINDGGEFVCWLGGHLHYDVLGVLSPDERQSLFISSTANCLRSKKETTRLVGTKAQDSFNCISIDILHKQIYLVKVGADRNSDNERKRVVRYNYCDYLDESGVLHKRGLVCSY